VAGKKLVNTLNCPSNKRPLEVLLLCDEPIGNAMTIRDHIGAFSLHSKHNVHRLGIAGELPKYLDLSRFDAIIIHYSIIAFDIKYLKQATKEKIKNFRGVKAIFVQDEYRVVDKAIQVLGELGIDIVFSLASKDLLEKLFPVSKLPKLQKHTVLTGYVSDNLLKFPNVPWEERRIDVGYRARKIPAWIGALGQEKYTIGKRFSKDAKNFTLNCDINCDEERRIYGQSWLKFITQCKAVLGAESGASLIDFTGEIQKKVESHEQQFGETEFKVLKDLYFKEEDYKHPFNVISPRCFEAAALKTLMIMYPGEYSGVLEPWRHYVPLNKDHSNMEEVISVLQTPEKSKNIIENAYQEIALNPKYHYKALVVYVDELLCSQFSEGVRTSVRPYSKQAFARLKITRLKYYLVKLSKTVKFLLYKVLFHYLFYWLPSGQRGSIKAAIKKLKTGKKTV